MSRLGSSTFDDIRRRDLSNDYPVLINHWINVKWDSIIRVSWYAANESIVSHWNPETVRNPILKRRISRKRMAQNERYNPCVFPFEKEIWFSCNVATSFQCCDMIFSNRNDLFDLLCVSLLIFEPLNASVIVLDESPRLWFHDKLPPNRCGADDVADDRRLG